MTAELEQTNVSTPPSRAARSGSDRAAATLRRSGSTLLLTIVIVIVGWEAILRLTGISSYVAKGPLDVLGYLFSDPDAAENRSVIGADLLITLVDTVVGFVAGLAAALLAAVVFTAWRGVEHALMPIAMFLASVPLVAMAPVVIIITGRGGPAVAVIGGIVVLFPSLVSIMFGLRSVSPIVLDVVAVLGGSSWTAIRKAAMPSAVPSLFAAVRISVPGAITGALLAEWLATGRGMGATIQLAIPRAQFDALWANVVVVTVVSLVLYNLVRVLESVVLARMGMRGR